MKESSYNELTDVERSCDERTEVVTVFGYPFAFVLRMRVVQIVCGISTLVMGSVALIDEKTQFNLAMGIPAGLSTVLAAGNSIYYSKGFDGYQPSSQKNEKWSKMRFLGSNLKAMTINLILWGLATILMLALAFNCLRTIFLGISSPTVMAVSGIELFLSVAIMAALLTILWVDLHNDPDLQEPSDIVHSNTGTGVSMEHLTEEKKVTSPAVDEFYPLEARSEFICRKMQKTASA